MRAPQSKALGFPRWQSPRWQDPPSEAKIDTRTDGLIAAACSSSPAALDRTLRQAAAKRRASAAVLRARYVRYMGLRTMFRSRSDPKAKMSEVSNLVPTTRPSDGLVVGQGTGQLEGYHTHTVSLHSSITHKLALHHNSIPFKAQTHALKIADLIVFCGLGPLWPLCSLYLLRSERGVARWISDLVPHSGDCVRHAQTATYCSARCCAYADTDARPLLTS